MESIKINAAKSNRFLRQLQSTIDSQIIQVDNDVYHMNKNIDNWLSQKLEMINKCQSSKERVEQSFFRWVKFWPALHIWLSAESSDRSSLNGAATLQGLVGEWRALRSIATDIKLMSDATSRHGKVVRGTHGAFNAVSFEASLRELKSEVDNRTRESIDEIQQLQKDIAILEKQQKQMRTLLLDLHYALEEDERSSRLYCKQAVTQTRTKSVNQNKPRLSRTHESTEHAKASNNSFSLGDEPDTIDYDKFDLPTESMCNSQTLSVTDSVLEILNESSSDRVYSQRANELEEASNSPPKSLVDDWIQSLTFEPSPISSSIIDAIKIKDPSELALAVQNANSGLSENYVARSKKSLNADLNPEVGVWIRKNGDELRASLAAFECRSIFRDLQLGSNGLALSYDFVSLSELGDKLYGQTVVIPPENCTHEETLAHFQAILKEATKIGTLNSMKLLEDSNVQTKIKHKQIGREKIHEKLSRFEEWLHYKRLGIQTAMSTDTVFPTSPKWLMLQATKLARGPMLKHHAEMIIGLPQDKRGDRPLRGMGTRLGITPVKSLKSEVVQVVPFNNSPNTVYTPYERKKSVHKIASDLSSDEEREIRKERRTLRVQTLVQKLNVNNDSHAKRRTLIANAHKLKSHIGANIVKPSEMLNQVNEGDDDEDDEEEVESDHFEDIQRVEKEVAFKNLVAIAADTAQKTIIVPHTTRDGNHKLTFAAKKLYQSSETEHHPSLPISPSPIRSPNTFRRKHTRLKDLVDKEFADQVITQLTLKMVGEVMNLIVYWQPKDERLKINALLYSGNEEYSFYISQADLISIFEHDPALQSANMQSPHLLQAIVGRMKIEKMSRTDALNSMMALYKPEEGQPRTDSRSAEIQHQVDAALSIMKVASQDDDDKVRVLTIRSTVSKALVTCCIAKVKNSHWENLMQAVPKHEHRENSIGQLMSQAAPVARPQRVTVF